MVELISNGVFLYHGTDIVPADSSAALDQQEVFNKERAYKETMAYRILMDHQQHEGDQDLRIKFDALTSSRYHLCWYYSNGYCQWSR